MSVLQITALLMTMTAIAGYLNKKFFKFPTTIGLLAFSSLFSLFVVIGSHLKLFKIDHLANMVYSINFENFVLHGVLSILLFAGALQVNIQDLKSEKYSIFGFATFGVLIASLLTGYLLYCVSMFLNMEIPYIYCLIFGTIIVPTDPVSVLGILNKTTKNKSLKAKIIGESLFNDGTGIILFLMFISIAFPPNIANHVIATTDVLPSNNLDYGNLLFHLCKDIFGGVIVGFMLAFIALNVIKTIDHFEVEVTITLALAFGSYALAETLYVSAPIATVIAGLYMGNSGLKNAMSERTKEHVEQFWNLLDEIVNGVLFILMGLELVVIKTTPSTFILCFAAIFAVLIGRYLSLIATGIFLMPAGFNLKKTPLIMTWAGLRGGISIALAISLPNFAYKETIITITYAVVLFSIIIQGLSLKYVILFFEQKHKKEIT